VPIGCVQMSSLLVLLLRYVTIVSVTCSGKSKFGKPIVSMVSAKCAAVEFTHEGPIEKVFVFAKRPKDVEYIQWGTPLRARETNTERLRILMKKLPPGEEFQVLLSADMHWDEPATNSPPSEPSFTRTTLLHPDAPRSLGIHRTDPRLNKRKADGSICVDLQWSHKHTQLNDNPDDVYFRISHQYIGEHRETVCVDEVGEAHRRCGVPIPTDFEKFPESYMTLCGLRPDRNVRFDVEAFNCDGQSVARHISAVTPPSAPNVIVTLVTEPGPQESIAGFQPRAVIDWIPQHSELIEGHAVYLGLSDIDAQKLLCWVPHGSSSFAAGHLSIPIKHQNYTFAEDSRLLDAYINHWHVHQEQEIHVSTRIHGKLESPAFVFRLGEFLCMDEALKCLTSFKAQDAAYVSHPVVISWTQEQGMALYD